jgi:hypothetical protein
MVGTQTPWLVLSVAIAVGFLIGRTREGIGDPAQRAGMRDHFIIFLFGARAELAVSNRVADDHWRILIGFSFALGSGFAIWVL